MGATAAPVASAAGSTQLSAPDTAPASAWMDDDGAATETDGLMVRHCAATTLGAASLMLHACLILRACASPGRDFGWQQLHLAAAESAAGRRDREGRSQQWYSCATPDFSTEGKASGVAVQEDDSEAGHGNFEQRKEAWRSEQDALNFPDEVCHGPSVSQSCCPISAVSFYLHLRCRPSAIGAPAYMTPSKVPSAREGQVHSRINCCIEAGTRCTWRHAAMGASAQVDTPAGVRASLRFAKYRGLKSWRASPWDPREELPREYARVFAFQNFKRAHKRYWLGPSHFCFLV